jgi:Domain of unknown function (DUF4203)
MNLSNALLVGAIVAILVGILACFYGYRVFRALFALLGFFAGAALGVALASILTLAPGQQTIVQIVLGLVGGLIGAALAWFLYIVIVFLSGAAMGALLGSAIALAVHAEGTLQVVLIVALAIIVGIIAVALQKLFIILATAFGGAQLIVSGVSQLLNGGATIAYNPLTLLQPGVQQTLAPMTIIMVVGWLVLGIVGAFAQYWITVRAARHDVKPVPGLSREPEIVVADPKIV